MKKLIIVFSVYCMIFNQCKPAGNPIVAPALFQYDPNSDPRWISFENPSGLKGGGGKENHGAKGHPCEYLAAGDSIQLLNFQGTGRINRIWLTINDRSVVMCRSLVINIYWDGASKPAVSAPLGDFFGLGFERKASFENELFSSGEGRSFVCHIPMPFKTGARVEIINESDRNLDMLFYDIDLQSLKEWPMGSMYFHGYWHRDTATALARDFEILPRIQGKGRYLGTNISVIDNPIYEDAWWGEGEVKVYLDQEEWPTLVGTGTEDYIGTAWGQGVFQNRYSGCLVGDTSKRHWAFYRYHIPDPVYFHQACKVTIQQIGGNTKARVMALLAKGLPLKPITVHNAPTFVHIYHPDSLADLSNPNLPDGWTNFYRIDDVSAMVYFYLVENVNELPALQGVKERVVKL